MSDIAAARPGPIWAELTWAEVARRALEGLGADDRRFRLLWGIVFGVAALDAVLLSATPVRLAAWPQTAMMTIPAALLLTAAACGVLGQRRIADPCLAFALMLLFVLVGYTFHCFTMRLGMPMVDGALAAADRALGIDWPALERWMTAPAWAEPVFSKLYASTTIQMVAVIVTLGVMGERDRLLEFAGCVVVAGLVTACLSGIFPAVGAHAHFAVPDGNKAYFVPAIVGWHSGALLDIDLSFIVGMGAFPSFHTVVSLLIVVAVWRMPGVGALYALFNVGVLLSVPVWGSHYVVDMFAGAAVAAGTVWAWRRWVAVGLAAPAPAAPAARAVPVDGRSRPTLSVAALWRALPSVRRRFWAGVALLAAVVVVWLLASPVSLAVDAFTMRLGLPAALLAGGAWYLATGRSAGIGMAMVSVAELLAFAAVAAALHYLLFRIGAPWADSGLAAFDRALGLDWVAYERVLTAQPVVEFGLKVLYASSAPQMLLVVLVLAFSREFDRLHLFVGTLVLSGLAVVVMSSFLPAVGPHAHFGVPDGGKAFFVPEIRAVHAGEVTVLDHGRMIGIATFPSFHTAISLAIIAATWRLPRWGVPLLVANLLLLVGVPVFGSHYFVDMLGGAALVAAAIALLRLGAPKEPRRP